MIRNSQKGAALITVLLVFFIASVIAIGMVTAQQLSIRRATHWLDRAQAYQFALGAESAARQLLFQDFTADSTRDTLRDNWAGAHVFTIKDGSVSFTVEDLQGRFNIAMLTRTNQNTWAAFRKLLKKLEIEIAFNQSMLLRMKATLPGENFSHMSELRLLPGMTEEKYTKLLPYLACLPDTSSTLNLNTAPELILSLFLPDDVKKKILRQRQEKGGLTGADIYSLQGDTSNMGAASQYFAVHIRIDYQGAPFYMTSIIERKAGGQGGVTMTTLSRDITAAPNG